MTTWQDLIVDHGGAVPLHTQLQRQVRSLISSGRWATGSRLPSETQLQRNLNVSRNTVRQALREIESEGLIERIPGRGSFVARELPRGRHESLVAMIMSDIDSELDILGGADRVARDNNYFLAIFNHRGSYREERRILSQLVQQNVSGVMLWSCAPAAAASPPLLNQEISLPPLVMVDRNTRGLRADFITSDSVAGARLVMEHLQRLGHRRIICLSHDVNEILPVAERIQGYRNAMAEAGDSAFAATWVLPTLGEVSLAKVLRMSQDPSSPPMKVLLRRLQEERPEAVFAINDHLACLTLRAAHKLGWKVPDDLSVIGYDNVEYGGLLTPSLSTVEQNFDEIGRRAMELLLERIDNPDLPPRTQRVPVTLIERATTGRPANRT